MRADERETERVIKDLTFKEGNQEEMENEGELAHLDRGDNRLLRLARHTSDASNSKLRAHS